VSRIWSAQYALSLRDPAKAGAIFTEVIETHDRTPGVHYAYGVHLFSADPEKGVEEMKRELEISPEHIKARLQLALEYIRRGEFTAALPLAEQAVKLAPELFVARNTLGQALLGLDQVERAVQELEVGVKLAPDSPETRFSLARAYAAAGRKEDAARQRSEFARLDRERRKRENPSTAPPRSEASPAAGGGPKVSTPQQLTTMGQRP
jgi:tetratricopeptide (TPR) repeat protein